MNNATNDMPNSPHGFTGEPNTQQASCKHDDAFCDIRLMYVVIAILSLSLIMVYSATIAADRHTLDINFSMLAKHLLHIGLGSLLLFIMAVIRLDWLQSVSHILLLVGFVLLVLVLFPAIGVEVNGSMRWIDLGGFRFQPSEFMKIASIIFFANYLSKKRDDLHRFKIGIFNVGLVAGSIGFLLLYEPDFGTTMLITTTVAIMMFLAGVRVLHLLVSLGVAGAIMALVMWAEPYVMARLSSFRDPWADPFGHGFQLIQALIAIGRGEWFGVGLGNSIQKLFYLPHAGNDFLIAIIGEELGAVGIFGVLMLFALLLFRAFAIARKAFRLGHRFSGFMAQGIGLLFTLQASVHVGVSTGLLPTKGLTLPLMSYGGSSMLSSMAAVGLLFAVDRQNRARQSGER